MSWDIFVQDLPNGIANTDEIPADFQRRPIGSRDDIIATIRRIVPTADFSDPLWGRIEGSGYSIEVNLGKEHLLKSFAFHIRGGSDAIHVIAAILRELNLRAIDPSSETGLFDYPTSIQGLESWRDFRDRVVKGDS